MFGNFSSVQSLSHVQLFATPWTAAARPPCPSPITRVYSNPCPLSWWCHPIISSSVVPFSTCLQSFPASGSFQMSQFFASGGQSIGVSASACPSDDYSDWFPLGWTGLISLLSKGLSRVFSNTTVQKHQFFSAQPSSQSTSMHDHWKYHSLDFILGDSKITADVDCIHEIKRYLLLGRETMTNRDSILKAETLLCQKRSI